MSVIAILMPRVGIYSSFLSEGYNFINLSANMFKYVLFFRWFLCPILRIMKALILLCMVHFKIEFYLRINANTKLVVKVCSTYHGASMHAIGGSYFDRKMMNPFSNNIKYWKKLQRYCWW